MEKTKIYFNNCDTDFLKEAFSLKNVEKSDVLEHWLLRSSQCSISDFEKTMLEFLQKLIFFKRLDWNEIELKEQFIGPLMTLVGYNTEKFSCFAERTISAAVGEYFLTGEPDMFVACGQKKPKPPFFCFHEYKRIIDNQGDPEGQVLAAMLAAQTLNNNETPIYGVYVIGLQWTFLILENKNFCVTQSYNSDNFEMIQAIFRMLKAIKEMFLEKFQNISNISR